MNFFSILLTFSCLPILTYASISFVLNPNCSLPECEQLGHPALYYAKNDIDNQRIHIFYSTFGELTISIVQTSNETTPTFNYSALFAHNFTGAIQFPDTKPANSFSIVLRRLIFFNDTKDNGTLSPYDNTTISYFLSNITTQNVTLHNNSTQQPAFELPLESINGSLTIDISYPGKTMRESKFPKLQTTSHSYFLNMALQANNYSFSNARFAFEFYIISPTNNGSKLFSSRYIDDQYTPGIFDVWQMHTIGVGNLYPASMLWKPVVYQSEGRSIEQTTLMKIYKMNNNITMNPLVDEGIFYSILPHPLVSGFNISLGASNDGFFNKANYTFIQLTAGLGYLQADSTAKFVSIALIAALAIPAAVAIIAIVFIFKRRCSSPPPTAYDVIDD